MWDSKSTTFAIPHEGGEWDVPVPSHHDTLVICIDPSTLPDTPEPVLQFRIDHSPDAGNIWSPPPSGEPGWEHGAFPVGFSVPGGRTFDQSGDQGSTSVRIPLLAGLFTRIRVRATPLVPHFAGATLTLATGSSQ